MATILELLPRLARAILCLALVAALLGQGLSHASETTSVTHHTSSSLNTDALAGDGTVPLDGLPHCAAHGCVSLAAFHAAATFADGRGSSAPRISVALAGMPAALPDKPPRS